jgi:2-polyprenyl-3-methyl-5-hydroxy-6-metoxy-1,4-benzoquinol methylase
MKLGREQVHNPRYSLFEKIYIAVFGMPIVGLRIRGRNVFSLIPAERSYANILDAGSGPGVFTFELARRFPDSRILGVDMLAESIEACNSIAQTIKAENVTFLQTSVEEINFENHFDLILCVDILEHIEDDEKTLQVLSKLLAPEGILILHVPALYRRYPIWKKSVNFDVETHVRPGYELPDIEEKVKNCGICIIDSGYTYGFFETLSNNISYMITHARMENKVLYSIAFPFLNLFSLLGAKARPKNLGAGIYVIAGRKTALSKKESRCEEGKG